MKSTFPSRDHFDWVATHDARARKRQRSFHSQLLRQFQHHIPEGERVLEVGCGAGDLLAGLSVSRGVGVDFSQQMLDKARAQYADRSELQFREADAVDVATICPGETFDHIVLDYLLGYLDDIQRVLAALHACAHKRTRLHITSLNSIWKLPVKWASFLGITIRQPMVSWLSHQDLFNLLELAGWEVVCFERIQLFPFKIPFVSAMLNNIAVRLPFLRHFGMTLWITARPRSNPEKGPQKCASGEGADMPNRADPSVSVVVPARNEAGNIREIIERIPLMGSQTEVIFVEGGSTDDTWQTIQSEMAGYQGPLILKAFQQSGRGKWDAVRLGFEKSSGDVLVIQDADMTAPPESLPQFYATLTSGVAEFVNGSRLIYPMESQAMRWLNFLGNKFFATALTYVLGQPVKDSLCGTKMLYRSDYQRLLCRIAVLGDFDPFGDFNLLFGASLLDLRIRDLPVRYKDRTYGQTNISRFRHGWLLVRMTWFALWRLKFQFMKSRTADVMRK